MSDLRRVRRAALVMLFAAVAATASFVAGVSPQPTDASWTVTKALAITATALTPAPPTALACTANGIGGNVGFTWTAPGGTTPSGYTLKWSGGSATFTTSPGSVPAPFLGNITVSVFSDYGSWESVAGTQTRAIGSLAGIWNCS
jgi:hypothetical protein